MALVVARLSLVDGELFNLRRKSPTRSNVSRGMLVLNHQMLRPKQVGIERRGSSHIAVGLRRASTEN